MRTGIGKKDLLLAASVSVFFGTGLGLWATPFGRIWPLSIYYFLPILPVAVVFTAIAIPIALLCIARGASRFYHSMIAGAFLGSVGSVLGQWVGDCLDRCTFYCRCSDHPEPALFVLGIPFGLASSCLFWAVLRHRNPNVFGKTSPLRGEEFAKLLALSLALGFFLSWMGFRFLFPELNVRYPCPRCL